MGTVFLVAMLLALLAVVAVLFTGLYALFRGGEFGRKYSNKLMRLRIVMQLVAIAIVLAAFAYWRWRGA
jgi:hypothetical protein